MVNTCVEEFSRVLTAVELLYSDIQHVEEYNMRGQEMILRAVYHFKISL